MSPTSHIKLQVLCPKTRASLKDILILHPSTCQTPGLRPTIQHANLPGYLAKHACGDLGLAVAVPLCVVEHRGSATTGCLDRTGPAIADRLDDWRQSRCLQDVGDLQSLRCGTRHVLVPSRRGRFCAHGLVRVLRTGNMRWGS